MRRPIAVVVLGIAAALVAAPALGATGTAMPFVKPQWFDSNGDPCNSCKLFVYVGGTSTKTTTYSESTLSSQNANPVVLDSAGRASVFLTPGETVKFVLTTSGDTDPPTSPLWTVDGVNSIPGSSVDVDVTGTAGEALSAGNVVYLSAGDGGRTAGRWYKADSDLDYGSTTAQGLGFAVAAISSGSSGSIRVAGRVTGLAGLATGTTYYVDSSAGAITGTPPTNARKVGIADSATSVITSQFLSPPDATATLAGIVSTTTQTFAGAKTFSGNVDVQGDLTWDVGAGTEETYGCGTIEVNTTAVGNVGAGVDDLMTYTIPANTLSRNGMMIWVEAWGSIAGADANREVEMLFGGTPILNLGNFSAAVSTGYTAWHVRATIIRTSAGNQRYLIRGRQGFAASWSSGTGDGGFQITSTQTKDETTALVLKFTGESANATNDDITQVGMIVGYCN